MKNRDQCEDVTDDRLTRATQAAGGMEEGSKITELQSGSDLPKGHQCGLDISLRTYYKMINIVMLRQSDEGTEPC